MCIRDSGQDDPGDQDPQHAAEDRDAQQRDVARREADGEGSLVREVAHPTGEQHEAEQREGPLEPAPRFEEPEAGQDRAGDVPADGARERGDVVRDVGWGSAASASSVRQLRHGHLPGVARHRTGAALVGSGEVPQISWWRVPGTGSIPKALEASPSTVYGARLLSGFGTQIPSRVQISPPPPTVHDHARAPGTYRGLLRG